MSEKGSCENSRPWPLSFGRMHVISVTPERRLKFATRCLKFNINLKRDVTFCQGVHGHTLNRNQYIIEKRLHPHSKLSRGQIGCWESHKALWRKLNDSQENEEPFILIAEDDTIVVNAQATRRKLHHAFTWLQKNVRDDWDVLFVTRSVLKRFTKKMVSRVLGIPGEFWGLNAYVVSRQGAKKLLAHPESECFNLPVDVVVARMCRRDQLNAFCCTPCVFKVQPEKSGTNNIV